MDKIQIQIIQPEVREAPPAGFFHLPVLVIPDLGRNEKVFPRDVSLVKQPLKRISNILLVPIYAGTVNQAISRFHRPVNRLCDLFRFILVRSERSDADRGNRCSIIQEANRYPIAVIRVFHGMLHDFLHPHSGKTTATFPHCPDAIREYAFPACSIGNRWVIRESGWIFQRTRCSTRSSIFQMDVTQEP